MNGSDSRILIVIISFLSMILSFLLICAISESLIKDRLVIEKRLKWLFNKDKQKDAVNPQKKKKNTTAGRKIKFDKGIMTYLQTAVIMIRPEELAIIWVVLAFVPSGLIALISGNVIISAIAVIIGIAIPPMYIKKRKKKRIAAFENQLGDALTVMCNCLRSGLTLNQAFENIGNEMSEPISKEFQRICTEIKYGTTLEKALNAMGDRIGSDDLMLAISAINTQRQIGGNLSEILQNISETIKARIKLKGDIKVMTASGRVSGLIIGVLPIVIALLISLLNPTYMLVFFETVIGKILLAVCVIMEIIGFLVVKKIITIKY